MSIKAALCAAVRIHYSGDQVELSFSGETPNEIATANYFTVQLGYKVEARTLESAETICLSTQALNHNTYPYQFINDVGRLLATWNISARQTTALVGYVDELPLR